MGQDAEKKLINDPKFIDYSSKYRQILDVFLAYKCELCITTGTGWTLQHLYLESHNIYQFLPVGNMTTYSKIFIFSIKIHYDRVKIKMNLKEISENPVAYAIALKF